MLMTVGSPLTQPRLQTRNHGAARAPVGSKTRAVPCASPWVRSGVYRSPTRIPPVWSFDPNNRLAYPPPTSKRRTSAVWLPATWPGTLDGWHCSQCGSRLCFSVAKGRFEYFFCLGRQRDTAHATSRILPPKWSNGWSRASNVEPHCRPSSGSLLTKRSTAKSRSASRPPLSHRGTPGGTRSSLDS